MRILYIFPHPDDESFGPAPVMSQQLKSGHEVFLLTLTRGGATKQRFKLNKSIEEMGEIRYAEMLCVKNVLGLTRMDVWNLPDGKLSEMDPRLLEDAVKDHIKIIRPEIIVSYPVHGVSGFHDHLVTHAIVKRVFVEMKETEKYLKRLAFLTMPDNENPVFLEAGFRIKNSADESIDAVINLNDEDIEVFKKCLGCYSTYKETIEESGVVEKIGDKVYFEFYKEEMNKINDITKVISN